jgi:CHAT domain-containing protein
VHFAGHAVFDDERPELSFLALAGNPGRLTATDVAALDLRRVRLVVLSACETMRAHGGRSGGFGGLTGAVLAAGAGGVVGSLWRVNDARTLELMREFHRAYRASGGDAARALRTAQLRQLHSPDPLRSSPAAWSGFRYAGN